MLKIKKSYQAIFMAQLIAIFIPLKKKLLQTNKKMLNDEKHFYKNINT